LSGVYDFYLYGRGNSDDQNGIFQLSVASQNYGTLATVDGPGWLSSVWQDGIQYVEFTNVIVTAALPVTITVEQGTGGIAVINGLQMSRINLPSNSPPVTVNPSNQFVAVSELVAVTNYAYSEQGPIYFSLVASAPAGAAIDTTGVFTWTPTCEQGSSTNQITVWVTDSSNPPLSNSMTFSVIVGDCAEIAVGSNVVAGGQSACVPVNLTSSVNLTNLSFSLAYPSGYLTNWSVSPSNPAIAAAHAQTIDPSHTQFSFGILNGRALKGTTVVASMCVETLPDNSQFVPLIIANLSAIEANASSPTNLFFQSGRLVVIGAQSLLDFGPGSNRSANLTLYGNPGVSYDVLSTTNLADSSSWSTLGNFTLTDLLQVVSLGNATNQMQFFKAVQP